MSSYSIELQRVPSIPLAVIRRNESRVRGVYGASVFLLRPDLHIVWRGDAAPDDAAGLAALATGWVGGSKVAKPCRRP